MDGSNPRNQADDTANPVESGETFVGTIRWIALAIGVACLALLTLVGGLAHAAAALDADAPRHGPGAMRAHMTALTDRERAQVVAMPANVGTSIERRDWRDQRTGTRTAGAVASLHG
jgi:hypothetical protein